MSQQTQPVNQPRVRLELLGFQPPPGEYWCATCCFLYMGAVNTNEEYQKTVQRLAAEAEKNGKSAVWWQLPDIPDKILRPAVTIAPSVYLEYAAPVCWVHIKGMRPVSQMPQQAKPSPLIPGKSYRKASK